MAKIKTEPAIAPKYVENFVHNLSSETFDENEWLLLNKGLNYTPRPNGIPLVNAVIDIETVLKSKTYSTQQSKCNSDHS